MRFLVIDADALGLDIALRAANNGHEVTIFNPNKASKTGQGFKNINISRDFKKSMLWVGKDGLVTITCNNTKYITELDRWRLHGYHIFAPTVASARLEIERTFGQEVMKQHGMNIAHHQEFKNLQDCLAFAKKTDKCFVHKPMGDEEDKSLTYVSDDPGQLVEWLTKKIKVGKKLKGSVMLQEKIPNIVGEIGIAAFMGKDGFLEDKWEYSFEHKKLCSGDYGPATGEQGTVIQHVKQGKLVDTLRSFETHLRAIGHIGDVSLNGAVDKNGEYWPFEWTCRPGLPDDPIRRSLHKTDDCEWMMAALKGQDILKVSYDCAIGVVVAQKPYPFKDGTEDEIVGNPIYGTEKEMDNLHFMDVMMSKGYVWDGSKTKEDKLPRTTGAYVLVATGHGDSVSKARESVYNTVDNISLSDMIVRDDIGTKIIKQLPDLHKLGYCEEIKP